VTVAACTHGGSGTGAGGAPGRPGWPRSVPLPPPRSAGDQIWLEAAGFDDGGCGHARCRLWEGWWSVWETGVTSVASLSPLLTAKAVRSRLDGPLDGARLAEVVTVDRGVA
jgi:hypothetical protein